MRLTRVLAPLAVAAALAAVPAPAAHAGCTDDFVAALGLGGPYYFSGNLSRYVEVNGLDVQLHGGVLVSDAQGDVGFVVGKAVYAVAVAPGAAATLVSCVAL
jgi:hypothetical protein